MDDVGSLESLHPVIAETDPAFDPKTTDWTLFVRVPERVRPWMVEKGSVAIEGISLTIAAFDDEVVRIAILPLTYWRTNLHALKPGAVVNIEADVLVKLAHSQILASRPEKESEPEFALTESWLIANGY